MIFVALGKKIISQREGNIFHIGHGSCFGVGGDDFKSSVFLLIGVNCSREALINLLTGREGDTLPFQSP